MKIYKDLLSIFEKKHLSRFFVLIFLMIVGAIMETFGISLIIPLVGTLLSDEFILPNQLTSIIPALKEISKEQMIFASISFFIFFYLIKSIYLGFLVYIQSKYIYSVQRHVSTSLYKTYL